MRMGCLHVTMVSVNTLLVFKTGHLVAMHLLGSRLHMLLQHICKLAANITTFCIHTYSQ